MNNPLLKEAAPDIRDSAEAVSAAVSIWAAAPRDPDGSPYAGMAEAGLFRIGLPAPYGSGGYADIGQACEALVRATGQPHVGMSFAVRQLIGRFFIAGGASPEECARWLPQLASGSLVTSIAISEANAGAHPKLLTTRAEKVPGGYRITGEKAWVTNGPIAGLILVLAVEAVEEGRKRYGLFLVPRETPGLTLKDVPPPDARKPGAHCVVVLDGCEIPATARLAGDDAYERWARPFRTLEDTIAAVALGAAFRVLLKRIGARARQEDATALGGLVGLASLIETSADAAVRALDEGEEHDIEALVGTRLLASELVAQVRNLVPDEIEAEPDIAHLITDIESMMAVARRARLTYQERLGLPLIGLKAA